MLAAEVAATLNLDEAVLDGEVIVADPTGRPQFYDLLRGRLAPAYVAFDLLWIDGVELRPKPLSERRVVLRGLLPEDSPTTPRLCRSRAGLRALQAGVRTRPRGHRDQAAL